MVDENQILKVIVGVQEAFGKQFHRIKWNIAGTQPPTSDLVSEFSSVLAFNLCTLIVYLKTDGKNVIDLISWHAN